MGMTLTTARLYARFNVRNGNDSSVYTDTSVDLAIAAIGARLVEDARLTRSIDTVSLVADTEAVSFSAPAGFLPEFLCDFKIRIVKDSNYADDDRLTSLSIVTPPQIAANKARCGTSSGVPREIAFEVEANAVESAIVWPPPKAAGSMEVCWANPFATFTAGTVSPNGVTFNVRDSILMDALRLGGPAYLQSNEPENARSAADSEAKLTAFIAKQIGKGGDGAQVIHRLSVRDLRRGY